MSTIITIANELQALQGRITADKTSLLEARAVMETEYATECKAESSALNEIVEMLNRLHVARRERRNNQHARLMTFIDGQIAAKDEEIEGDVKQAAE